MTNPEAARSSVPSITARTLLFALIFWVLALMPGALTGGADADVLSPPRIQVHRHGSYLTPKARRHIAAVQRQLHISRPTPILVRKRREKPIRILQPEPSPSPPPPPTPTPTPEPEPTPTPQPEPTPTPEPEPAPEEPSPSPPPTPTPEPKPTPEPLPSNAYYVSTAGSDSNPGTSAKPWRTLAKAVATVRPGDTVVLRSGTYGARGTVDLMSAQGTASAPITFRGYPGEADPRILGFFKITGSYQQFSHLLFDGPTGSVKAPTSDNPSGEQVQVSIIGSSVRGIEIAHSEIRNSHWHAGIYLEGAENARIVGNYIHNNGDPEDPGQANQSHGIYWYSGSGGLIANNLIKENIARGIQLCEYPRKITITNNTVVDNGKAGIQFSNETSESIAVNNIVADNGYGIRGYTLTGAGNTVQNNLLWQNSSGNLVFTENLALRENTVADPRFENTTDYKLKTGSPAIDKAISPFAQPSDYSGLPAPIGAARDLGAYESH